MIKVAEKLAQWLSLIKITRIYVNYVSSILPVLFSDRARFMTTVKKNDIRVNFV